MLVSKQTKYYSCVCVYPSRLTICEASSQCQKHHVRKVTQMVGLDVSLYHKFMVFPLEIFSETFGQWTKVWSIDLDIEAFLFYFHSSGSNFKNCIFQKSFRFVYKSVQLKREATSLVKLITSISTLRLMQMEIPSLPSGRIC